LFLQNLAPGKATTENYRHLKTYNIIVLDIFHFGDKISEQVNLKEKRFILVHSFISFSPWSAGSIALKPVARQKHHGRRTW
jgi:hypothetical protein